MQIQKNMGVVSLEKRCQLTRCRVKRLLAILHGNGTVNGEFGDIGDLLSALPLAADQYALATRRLANARRYLTAGERGAAEYELRLLEGSLLAHASALHGDACLHGDW